MGCSRRYEGDLVFSLASAQPCSALARACGGWVGQTVPNGDSSLLPLPATLPLTHSGQREGLSPLGPAAMPYSPAGVRTPLQAPGGQ